MIKGFAHVALYTEKFEETISFYENAFDARNLGYIKTTRRGCWLQIGDSYLEIFESEALPAEGAFKHIAIECDSVDTMIEKTISFGATLYQAARDITLDLNIPKKLKIAFIKGVNGEQIELVENR